MLESFFSDLLITAASLLLPLLLAGTIGCFFATLTAGFTPPLALPCGGGGVRAVAMAEGDATGPEALEAILAASGEAAGRFGAQRMGTRWAPESSGLRAEEGVPTVGVSL